MSQTGLTQADKQDILDRHNSLRGQVSPSASNMERMVRLCVAMGLHKPVTCLVPRTCSSSELEAVISSHVLGNHPTARPH